LIFFRFSKDLDDVDVRLPLILDMFVQQVGKCRYFWQYFLPVFV